MAELELRAAFIPEPSGITTVDPQARPAVSPLRSGPRLGLPMHQKPGDHGNKIYGVGASISTGSPGLREEQCGCLPVQPACYCRPICVPEH